MRQARMSWSFMLGLGLLLAACGGGDARGSDGGGGDVGGSPGEGGTNTTAATINGGGAAAETPAGDSAECEQTTVHNGRVACSERIVGGDSSQIFSYAPDGSDRRPLDRERLQHHAVLVMGRRAHALRLEHRRRRDGDLDDGRGRAHTRSN